MRLIYVDLISIILIFMYGVNTNTFELRPQKIYIIYLDGIK